MLPSVGGQSMGSRAVMPLCGGESYRRLVGGLGYKTKHSSQMVNTMKNVNCGSLFSPPNATLQRQCAMSKDHHGHDIYIFI